MHSILLECLPADLPEKVNVDVSQLEIGDAIHVSDINIDNKVSIMNDSDAIIASVLAPKVEEEAELEAETESEPEVITEKQSEE